jgi:hypothetical protein
MASGANRRRSVGVARTLSARVRQLTPQANGRGRQVSRYPGVHRMTIGLRWVPAIAVHARVDHATLRKGRVIARDPDRPAEDAAAVWAKVAEVVDEVEAELDLLVAAVEDRVVARIQATEGALSAPFQDALHRGLLAAMRDVLARLRSQAELPQELSPDLIELARLWATEVTDFSDAWLVGGEVFWDRFQVVAERTLRDSA